ncbi:MAG: hypothetical protein LBL77_01520 [Endomicrobium sp.]|jgi:putative NIF3 family GTP cyclohydrolase 1 type 2|nr:hypothetical protein [Endomicrobium sp.]
MKLEDVYKIFIREGMEADPRGVRVVEDELLRRKKEYDVLSDKQKESYDIESLTNPYYDSRILYGDANIDVRSIMVGIDIETQELLLAKYLMSSSKNIDLVIAHHPEGYAYSTFYSVIGMQADILSNHGIPINITEKIVSNRMKEVQNSIFPKNNERIYDVARILNIPLMIAHTVADNQVASFLQKEISLLNPTYLREIVDLLNKYPEYQHAIKIGHAPFILNGNDYSKCGKVFVDMTGGAECPIQSFERLANAGIGTIITMHLSPESVKEIEKYHINIILAGHISSDNLGMNLLFDKLEKKSTEKFEFIECSGFRRFRR